MTRQALWAWLTRLGQQPRAGMPFSQRVNANLLRLVADGLPQALFYFASAMAINMLLPQADIARTAAQLLRQSLGVTGLYLVAGRFLLSPGEPLIRLLALPRAERHFKFLALYGFLGAFTIASIGLTSLVATNAQAAAGWFTLWGLLLLGVKLVWFWDARHDTRDIILSGAAKPQAVSATRRFCAAAAPFALIGTAILIWAVSRVALAMSDGVSWGRAAGITQFMVVLVPILAEGAAQFAR